MALAVPAPSRRRSSVQPGAVSEQRAVGASSQRVRRPAEERQRKHDNEDDQQCQQYALAY